MKTPEEQLLAEEQIKGIQTEYLYRIADYSIGELLKKFVLQNEEANFEEEYISGLIVPQYQRKFVWNEEMQSKFIESLFMGVPIQPLFAFELDEDGNMELLDGVQRLSSIKSFFDNHLILTGLEELSALNGFIFSDLNSSRQRKFLNIQIKLYIINENTDEGVRADIFRRVNEGGKTLTASEIRQGKFMGNSFYSFILEMAESEEFNKLFSSNKKSDKLRGEKEELVSRFFALSNDYLSFEHSVKGFIDNYILNTGKIFDDEIKEKMAKELNETLSFIEKNIPNGFRKTEGSKSIPRVRFEALSVGTNLALRDNPDLEIKDTKWIDSNEFKKWTTSDAANNKNKVVGRIEFVRDCLLGKIDINSLSYGD
ncbi:DUF262 domain-containing protein [Chryseobacterium taihuense]|uniref:GmrSD restriction endonucleases N-terminal domain-containing protein n=1 Tax=Chryseobacterium taihuense TaxID=1141221 RepID=A0ABY0QX73_9FLAO|nr:DUF262 domain-containing protein [Chryseobacterium taihuense]SDM07297.1 Protein of unknown function DUF262 [Chryseobacterium taihuense]